LEFGYNKKRGNDMANKKIVLVVMDGVGITEEKFGNAVLNANTPNLDLLMEKYPHTLIKAHGSAVGLPSDDDMGNSEVGHNALGCGQIYSQGAKLVNEAIESKEIFNGEIWKKLVSNAKDHTMHFIGLLSDGNVHSHIKHLFVLMEQAKKDGVKNVRVHILLDGRDVEETSALKYVDMLENKIKELNDDNFNAMIASGGGRMTITMDRYEANWKMVEKGWEAHVLGIGRGFESATSAIETYRKENNVIDQDLDSFVIEKDGKPVGTIEDHDSVIFFNFRGDRALEISRCFDEKDEFDKFDRKRVPDVMYAGMLQYDADLKIPHNYLTEPPKIKYTLTEELCKYNIREYAISETQKFGHVTYFWNGNRTEKFDEQLETYEEVDSDVISFDKKPKMKAFEITDKLVDAILSDKYDFLRTNFPNGDMVGHTGNYEATIEGIEAVDENLGRIMKAVDEANATLLVMADHGNAEEMYQLKDKTKKVAKTSHTLNPVPFILYGKDSDKYEMKKGNFGLANVASTVATLFEISPNEHWLESIIEKKK
jgi:2,3-bisphosphoglycerate-independent phosphoglycerate mutase